MCERHTNQTKPSKHASGEVPSGVCGLMGLGVGMEEFVTINLSSSHKLLMGAAIDVVLSRNFYHCTALL